MNIEKCYFLSNNLTFFSIFYYDHVKTIIYIFHLLRRKNFTCHLFQNTDYFFVSVNCSFSFVFSSIHILKNHTHHPDNSKKMIDMLMCHENISHIHPVNSRCFQLMKNRISATTVYHKMTVVITDHKACVIALRNGCISCSKYCKLHFFLLFV